VWYSKVSNTDPVDEVGIRRRYFNFIMPIEQPSVVIVEPRKIMRLHYGEQPLQKGPAKMSDAMGRHTRKALSTPNKID
jgi:hypothetical protein